MTEHWTSADLARRSWTNHAAGCRVCRVDETRCERGKRLGHVSDQARQSGRRRKGA